MSTIARLYDPNGYIAPVIITAKILIQDLWRCGLKWDEEIPTGMKAKWSKFSEELEQLTSIRVPRWLGSERANKLELHGFADASTRAYAAVVYMRSESSSGETSSLLVASKTRVAPLKTITVPRLDLCAAVLLCKLMTQVVGACKLDDIPITYWSDSTVVLYWLTKIPAELKTFVANRVSIIQQHSGGHPWKHVSSGDNPADLASRGIPAAQLVKSTLWWEGPHWLMKQKQDWPNMQLKLSAGEQAGARSALKPQIVAGLTLHKVSELSVMGESLLTRKSTLQSTLRVTALVLRFMRKCRRDSRAVQAGPVTPSEREEALAYWEKTTQRGAYRTELSHLRTGRSVDVTSSISTLFPFIDADGIMRVGGRLHNADLHNDAKHPIILPARSKLVELIMREAHIRTLHGGVQLSAQYIRQRYWVPTLRRALRNHIGKCITCFRQKQRVSEQLMGSLAKERVQRARAFRHSGVDYAGPVRIKARAGRSNIIEKGYIAVFVCLATRAIHLEPVSNQSTEAFLAAFQRFTGRRGACSVLWSDNATTFVGANRELRKNAHQSYQRLPIEQIVAMGTEWKFIVPGAPHTGGIWEAGVKAMKHHLRRVMGNTIFTFETLATTLVMIEACLNSRPISALSDDPSDLTALTPGHFLIGEQIVQPLTPDVTEIPQNRLKLWNVIHQMQQHFWKRWSEEYMSNLQQRFKWKEPRANLRVGDLVLLKQENMPPAVWPLGRITVVRQGKDGLVRSAEIKLQHTTLVRPVQKLCLLPNQEQTDSN